MKFIRTWDNDLINADDISRIYRNHRANKWWDNYTIEAILKNNSEVKLFQFPARTDNELKRKRCKELCNNLFEEICEKITITFNNPTFERDE